MLSFFAIHQSGSLKTKLQNVKASWTITKSLALVSFIHYRWPRHHFCFVFFSIYRCMLWLSHHPETMVSHELREENPNIYTEVSQLFNFTWQTLDFVHFSVENKRLFESLKQSQGLNVFHSNSNLEKCLAMETFHVMSSPQFAHCCVF